MASPPPRKRPRHSPPSKPEAESAAAPVQSRSFDRPRTVYFRYRPDNGPHRWGPEEAFRELVRRWRDDIIRINGIREEDFAVIPRVSTQDGELQICYQVPLLGSEPKKYLGHIRYLGTDGLGCVEIVTRGLHLPMNGKEEGPRGAFEAKIPYESLETAILVFMISPRNHTVRLRSGLLDWRFNFNRHGMLLALQNAICVDEIQDILEAIEDIESEGNVSSEALPPADTQLIVGEPGKGYDEHGNPSTRAQVKEEDFREWARVALFLWDLSDGRKSITTGGEIILDRRFAGFLYYDGLLLHRQDSTKNRKRPLKYAYNLPRKNKYTNEGTALSADDQASAIIAIWNKVLTVRPLLAAELSEMLNDTTIDYGDIAGAEDGLDYDAALLLRRHLLGDSTKRLWYFSAEEKASNPQLQEIIQRLGCEGRELTRRYWSIMSRHKLLNTAEHELQKRPRSESTVPDTEVAASTFATEMARLSNACIKLCGSVKDYRTSFIRGAGVEPALSFNHELQVVEIPGKWLDRKQVMEDLEMPQHWEELDMIIHAVYTLFVALLGLLADEHLTDSSAASTGQRTEKGVLSEIHYRLLGYNKAIRQIHLHHPRGEPTALLMSGTALTDTGWARAGHVIEFQLHPESCSHVGMLTAHDLDPNDSSLTVGGGSGLQNGDASADTPDSRTCQSAELKYFCIAINRSDPLSIAIALKGRRLPDKLSATEELEVELATGRHFIGVYQSYIAESNSSRENRDKCDVTELIGTPEWEGKSTFMMP